MSKRERFEELSDSVSEWKAKIQALDDSREVFEGAESLTDIELEEGYGVESPLHEAHRMYLKRILEGYKDKHPRRRKIPLSRIVDEYGKDVDVIQELVESHNTLYRNLQDEVSEAEKEQRGLAEEIDIREGDEPTVFQTFEARRPPMNRARSGLEIECQAGFQALWLNRFVRTDWIERETFKLDVRTWHHPDDQAIVDKLCLCRDGEAFVHYYLENEFYSHLGLSSGRVHVDPGEEMALFEEHNEHPEYGTRHPKGVPGATDRYPGELYGGTEEQWKNSFREHRQHPPFGEADGWFTENPEELKADTED